MGRANCRHRPWTPDSAKAGLLRRSAHPVLTGVGAAPRRFRGPQGGRMTIMPTRRRDADQRHGRVRRGRGVGLLAAMLLAAGLTASPAHAVGSSAGGRLLDVTAHDNGPSGPQRDFYTLNTNQVKAGLVEVRLHNAGTVPHQVQLLRLHDGVTLTSFV